MEITVNFKGLDSLSEAINNLAKSLGKSGVTASLASANSRANAAQSTLPPGGTSPAQPASPLGGMLPTQPAPPIGGTLPTQPVPPLGGTLPTTVVPQEYTYDQIAVAMTGLVDQGKQPQVMQILAQFGAGSLMQMPKERYPDLVIQLRGLGAAI